MNCSVGPSRTPMRWSGSQLVSAGSADARVAGTGRVGRSAWSCLARLRFRFFAMRRFTTPAGWFHIGADVVERQGHDRQRFFLAVEILDQAVLMESQLGVECMDIRAGRIRIYFHVQSCELGLFRAAHNQVGKHGEFLLGGQ